jgi:hypothetical protein
MNLLETIHDRWAADADLTRLLAATSDETTNRVHTGLNFTPILPYAVLEKQGGSPVQRTECGTIDRVSLRMQVFTANQQEGEKIIRAIKAAFDREEFDLEGGTSSSSGEDTDSVLNMQRTHDAAFQEADGVWRFIIDFDVLVFLTDGY